MILIQNGYIKTMTGKEYENGCILLGDDGKISKIAPFIEAPEGAYVIDAEGKLVTPGCVDAHCHIGLHEQAMRWEGSDINEKGDPITPHMRAIDAIRPHDEMFENAISHGVTCGVTGPGSANVVGGTFAAIKLWGESVDEMIVKEPVAMKVAFGENPKGAYGNTLKKLPVTRMGNAAMLRETLFRAKEYLEAKNSDKPPKFDMKMEAMLPVMRKEIPLKAHAHRADDILTSIRIAKEFDLNLTLDHCTEGWLIADILAKEGYPAFVGPTLGSKSKIELAGKSFRTAAVLHEAGVNISIITDTPVVPIQYLPLSAGLHVAAGLPEEEAWKAITINPATACGIADRVGSLEEGKDADVVIWTADPLKVVGAQAYVTIINGEIVYQ